MTTVKPRSLETIEAEIAQTKEALQNVKGRETEVYARIVGYYRSVRNWNKGKREEYDHRKMFEYDGAETPATHVHTQAEANSAVETNTHMKCDTGVESKTTAPCTDEKVTYEFFSRKSCPNCPSVREYLKTSVISGKLIDVDTLEGLERARQLQILSAPTVVFFDESGTEIGRAQSVKELSEIFEMDLALTEAC